MVVISADDLARGIPPPPGSEVVTSFDLLSPSEQARQGLLGEIGDLLGDANWDWVLVDTRLGRQSSSNGVSLLTWSPS